MAKKRAQDVEIVVPVACETVDWAASDHSIREAEIHASAVASGFILLERPQLVSAVPDQYSWIPQTILTYQVAFGHAGEEEGWTPGPEPSPDVPPPMPLAPAVGSYDFAPVLSPAEFGQ